MCMSSYVKLNHDYNEYFQNTKIKINRKTKYKSYINFFFWKELTEIFY